jgi:hypothetical protein
MRWVSSKESVAKGEVSVLAIVETLCAIALVFYLSSHFNTPRWVAIAMCVSPLLLLRTEESTRLGIKSFDQRVVSFMKWLDKNHGKIKPVMGSIPLSVRSIINMLVLAGLVVLTSSLIRICATFWCAARYPVQALRSIPTNWSRLTLERVMHLA